MHPQARMRSYVGNSTYDHGHVRKERSLQHTDITRFTTDPYNPQHPGTVADSSDIRNVLLKSQVNLNNAGRQTDATTLHERNIEQVTDALCVIEIEVIVLVVQWRTQPEQRRKHLC